ncbi:hypothetical protein ES319_D10G167600v1 [Gossypium barbadense]|uniref:Phytocyanin domain-containing protein n=2 Tax=Gossypium TaxID=3633 RepID=A0A5J5PS40_GOSBA|nr:hypothetical protein ES319_D10G167600v1 [Gossypium barbadense]TYG50495.1 hypothetical protein ES288_D10G179700v1 [Gossypium darwinii]
MHDARVKTKTNRLSLWTINTFFEYNAQLHNVMRVTHSMYRACNTSSPLATYTTDNDSIKITTKAGQKVDINVLRLLETAPASAPSGSTLSPPPVHSVSVPVSSPSNALTLKASKGNFAKLGLAITVLQFLYQVSH